MPPPDNTVECVDRLKQSLRRLRGSQLTGAQIRSLLDDECPDFDLRAATNVPLGASGALTRLLTNYFQDLVQPVGRKGADIVYAVNPIEKAPPATISVPGARSADLWTAFAVPSSGLKVVLCSKTFEPEVRSLNAAAADDEVAITPVTQQEFRTIADRFLDSVDGDVKQKLQGVLDTGTPFYQQWLDVLRESDPQLRVSWGAFRVRQLIELFATRLSAAGVPAENIQKLTERLSSDQLSIYALRSTARRSTAVVKPLPSQSPQSINFTRGVEADQVWAGVDIRAIAIQAVRAMSIDDIRKLRIPLGALLDTGLLQRR